MSTPVNLVFMNISGKRLRDLLDERGIAYRDFATAMGVEPQHVNNWFNRGIPKARIFKVADFLQVNARWLADGEGDSAPDQQQSSITVDGNAKRFEEALSLAGITGAELARRLGLENEQNITNWKSRGVPAARVSAVAAALNVSRDWLESGQGEPQPATSSPSDGATSKEQGAMPCHLEPLHPWDSSTPLDDDEVEIPLYKEVELAAGSGRTAVREVEGRKLRFSHATMRAAGVCPSQAVCATVSGNSMEPLIMNGATIGLDRGTIHVVDGEIYALEHDGMLRVKFLYRLPGGGIRLRSFNREEHKDEDYSLQQQQDQNIRILGRVFWWSTIRPLKSAPLI